MSAHRDSRGATKLSEEQELAKLGAALVARLSRTATDPGPLTLTETRAAKKLGVSAGFFKRYVLPELRVVRRGARVLVPESELMRWIDRNAARTVDL
jgi:hypothetical protein